MIFFLNKRIELLPLRAEKLIREEDQLGRRFDHLVSVTGIARASAIQILGELAVLPEHMNKRQWTAHAGLDPRKFDSGTSVHRPARITGAWNHYLRKTLYMPALVAIRREKRIRAYYEHLLEAGKRPFQAIVAVMRKLLCAIWWMFTAGQDFDPDRFYGDRAVSA